mmetsp:Transcript_62186/g.103325  ORF Transcript_62186/g.103325 Transcript_62186/m.103325 type:complete len:731 (-) Transcript_62186:86-2278(-)
MTSVKPYDASQAVSPDEKEKGQNRLLAPNSSSVERKESFSKGKGGSVRFSQFSPRADVHIVEEGYDGAQMFGAFDPEKMKEGVRAALLRPPYNVANFYHKTGVWQHIARNPVFENVTLFVISVNAFWMMIDTDNNGAATLLEADPIFQIAEHSFCLYFSFEWFVRFMAFKRKRDGLQDGWFVFDSLLVFMMVMETWLMTFIIAATGGGSSGGMGNTGILRLFRLLRLSRMARMLRSMPELMILIKGMVAATRSVFFTLVLLLAILYIFAIAFTQLCDGTEVGAVYFDSILSSMYTLLIVGTFYDNLGDVLSDVGRPSLGGHLLFGALFMLFIALAALMVMNMLIGILCEVVSAVAATEKEQMRVDFVKGKMEEVVSALDNDGDMMISKAEFIQIMQHHDAVHALEEVDVDPLGLVDMVDFIFEDDAPEKTGTTDFDEDDHEQEKQLSLPQFMDVVLQLRGNNTATVKDVVDFRKFLGIALRKFEERLGKRTSSVCNRLSMMGTPSMGRKSVATGRPSDKNLAMSPSAVSDSSRELLSPLNSPPRSVQPQKGRYEAASSPSKSELHKRLGHVDGFLKAGMFELQRMRNVVHNSTDTGTNLGDEAEQQATNNKTAVSSQMAAVEEFLSLALGEIQKARGHMPPMSRQIVSDSESGVDSADIRLWMARLESFIIATGLGELHSLKDKMWKVSRSEESDQSQEQIAWLTKVDDYLTTSVAGLRRIRQGLICELT